MARGQNGGRGALRALRRSATSSRPLAPGARGRRPSAAARPQHDSHQPQLPGAKVNPESTFEVEQLLDRMVFEDAGTYYLVKWKNWDPSWNTWEPAGNLADCNMLVRNYLRQLSEANAGKNDSALEDFKRSLLGDAPTLDKFAATLRTEEGWLRYDAPTELQVRQALRVALPRRGRKRLTAGEERAEAARQTLLRALHERRIRQRMLLNEWQQEMSELSSGQESLRVENQVDLEGPPEDFLYTIGYLPGQAVELPTDQAPGCVCRGDQCALGPAGCCSQGPRLSRPGRRRKPATFAADGRLLSPPGTPIYECGERCSCARSRRCCGNRVVQRGRRVPLAIFRTPSGCGWGLRALQAVPAGTFVCEYAGVVIHNEEAQRRARSYPRNLSYLFALDFDGPSPYTVDSTSVGNESRFINHSCRPNMAPYAVWCEWRDPSLPRIAFFTLRDVAEGEELTFDYGPQSRGHAQSLGPVAERWLGRASFPNPTCKCGAPRCRGYVF